MQFKHRRLYGDDGRVLRGLSKVVRKVFAPNYKFSRLRGRPRAVSSLTFRAARRRGLCVDRALGRWADGSAVRTSRLVEVKTLLALFAARQYRPLSSQTLVSWPAARLGTKLDLVLLDTTTNRTVVVEVKTGCHYRHCAVATLIGTKDVSDCALHQHQLQAQMGAWMFCRGWQQAVTADAMLVYVDAQGRCDVYDQSQFAPVVTEQTLRLFVESAKKPVTKPSLVDNTGSSTD